MFDNRSDAGTLSAGTRSQRTVPTGTVLFVPCGTHTSWWLCSSCWSLCTAIHACRPLLRVTTDTHLDRLAPLLRLPALWKVQAALPRAIQTRLAELPGCQHCSAGWLSALRRMRASIARRRLCFTTECCISAEPFPAGRAGQELTCPRCKTQYSAVVPHTKRSCASHSAQLHLTPSTVAPHPEHSCASHQAHSCAPTPPNRQRSRVQLRPRLRAQLPEEAAPTVRVQRRRACCPRPQQRSSSARARGAVTIKEAAQRRLLIVGLLPQDDWHRRRRNEAKLGDDAGDKVDRHGVVDQVEDGQLAVAAAGEQALGHVGPVPHVQHFLHPCCE